MEMDKIINDFTINIATANGTGSQSANLILLNTLFRMGTHASGKNLFPSNIAGLPTWYIVRVSDQGYQAPGDRTHIQVTMNVDTWAEDIENLEPGTVLIHNTDTRMPVDRDDLILYPVPMTSMARKINPKLAKMVANMIYVGIMAEMLEIPQAILEQAITKQFGGKEKAIQINSEASIKGREYFREELEKSDNFYVEKRKRDKNQFLIDGNETLSGYLTQIYRFLGLYVFGLGFFLLSFSTSKMLDIVLVRKRVLIVLGLLLSSNIILAYFWIPSSHFIYIMWVTIALYCVSLYSHKKY